jgi:nicotinate-nucleotide adenylyltransferase
MTSLIGLLGGTFDPIHLGHLRMAEELGEALGCHEVRFIPSGTPPHRAPPKASAEQRCAWVATAIADNPRFVLDTREVSQRDPGYMIETLTAIRAEVGEAQPLALFLGADAALELHTWHRWREIFDLAHIAIATRPGSTLTPADAELAIELQQRAVRSPAALAQAPAGSLLPCQITALDISASAIRAACADGRSIRYLLPDAVLSRLFTNNPYR